MDKNVNKLIMSVVIVAVVFGGVGFFGGMQYQKSKTPASGARNFAGGNLGGAAAGQQGNNARRSGLGGFTSGQIISKDSQSITIKITGGTSSGSSKIVLYSPSTQIAKQAAGTADDLSVGSTVMVTGSTNSDGSITAQSISLRPTPVGGTAPGGPGNGGQQGQGTPTQGSQPAPAGTAPGAAQ